MKLYVGNLPWSTTDADLEAMFTSFGPVDSARVITDRDTGRSRGFGFVEMQNGAEAMQALNGTDVGGRTLRVNEANEQRRNTGGGSRF